MDYRGSQFDEVWQIKFVFNTFHDGHIGLKDHYQATTADTGDFYDNHRNTTPETGRRKTVVARCTSPSLGVRPNLCTGLS